MDNITKLVGTRIRGFRKEKRLSQEELAEKYSLHPTYIGQLERGEKNPTIESVMKNCKRAGNTHRSAFCQHHQFRRKGCGLYSGPYHVSRS